MKKQLLKAMPHIPILELRPELREQDEAAADEDDRADQINDGATAEETEANTTFHNLEERTTAKYGLVQKFKRYIFRTKVCVRNTTAGTRVRTEDNIICYGDDESSDNEGDLQDEIPLVRRNTRN